MQIPIPQSGPLGSPLTEVRQGSPDIIIAAATLISEVTRTCVAFTVMKKVSFRMLTLSLPRLETASTRQPISMGSDPSQNATRLRPGSVPT